MKEAGRKIRKAGGQRRGERNARACTRSRVYAPALVYVPAVEEKTRERESIDPTLSPAAGTPSWPNFTPPSFHPSVVVRCIPICLIFFPSIPPLCLSLSRVCLSPGILFFPSTRLLWPAHAFPFLRIFLFRPIRHFLSASTYNGT